MTTDQLSAIDIAEAVHTGSIGALETLDATFDRVADLDPSIRAFTTVLRADGRSAGAAVDAKTPDERAALPWPGCRWLSRAPSPSTTRSSRPCSRPAPSRWGSPPPRNCAPGP
ncbi:hypothetical protein ACFSSF_13845 [Dietzia aerolata]|uniref:hypothetical protein n=1 Tax=Dietzia aerolata TaxID=595984 RepID=UPI0036252A76